MKYRFTRKQEREMLEAAKPLMKWMSENVHPHVTAHVSSWTLLLVEGIATGQTEEFLKDKLPPGWRPAPEPEPARPAKRRRRAATEKKKRRR